MPNSYGGISYEVIETFNGTEKQAIKYAGNREKGDPEVICYDLMEFDEVPDRHTRIEYFACGQGWLDDQMSNGVFKITGYDSEVQEDNYESMSKEQLIEIIIQLKKDKK